MMWNINVINKWLNRHKFAKKKNLLEWILNVKKNINTFITKEKTREKDFLNCIFSCPFTKYVNSLKIFLFI